MRADYDATDVDGDAAPFRCWTAVVAWVASLAVRRVAQTPEGALTGTLQKVRASGEVAIGYREASIPLSYLSARNEPIGYSIDICRAIVDAMSTGSGARPRHQVGAGDVGESHQAPSTGGQVDLECGSHDVQSASARRSSTSRPSSSSPAPS